MSLMPTIDDSYLSVSVRGCSSWCGHLIYFYDYKGNYTIYINNFTRETIINAYLSYVEKFSIGRMQAEQNKFYSITEKGWGFVSKTSQI